MTKRKVFHNRDIKIKVSLINHIQYFLDFLEIDEEIDVLLTNEIITDDFRNLRMDYVALCKSGMIIEAEGELNSISEKTMDKTWNYIDELRCTNDKRNVTCIIFALDNKNKIKTKKMGSLKFEPHIFEFKKLDGEENLNKIRSKIENNQKLNHNDCALLENIPDMNHNRDVSEVVTEICYLINKAIISEEEWIKLRATMFLNIDYYVEDKKIKNELMELINVEEAVMSDFDRLQKYWKDNGRDEGRKEGKEEGRKEGKEEGRKEKTIEFVRKLSESMSPEEIVNRLDIPLSEVKSYINVE